MLILVISGKTYSKALTETEWKLFTQRLFGFGYADNLQLMLLFRLSPIDPLIRRSPVTIDLSLICIKHLRQRGSIPAVCTLQSEPTFLNTVCTFLLPAMWVTLSEDSPSPLRVRLLRLVWRWTQRSLIEVDGANGADVSAERGGGVTSVSQQPVGVQGTSRVGSELSGLMLVSIHRYVQKRWERIRGLRFPPGSLRACKAELLQFLQQVALLFQLLRTVELEATSVIWRERQYFTVLQIRKSRDHFF